MSVEIAWKQNILVTDFHLLKSLLVVFGFGSQAFVCGFSRQNINSVVGIENDRLMTATKTIPDMIDRIDRRSELTLETIKNRNLGCRVLHTFIGLSKDL